MGLDPKQVARRLEARARKAREARDDHASEVAELVRREAGHALPPGGRAWLIGSLAWGGFGARSDIDVVVQGLSSADVTRLEALLSQRTGRFVEILGLDELPDSFGRRVRDDGVPLHAS